MAHAATAIDGHSSPAHSNALNVSLWVVQVLLAAAFGIAGIMKATAPMAELAQAMVWPAAVPEALVRFIGASEFAGALGLILPAATRIRPNLTPLAAAALVLVMVLAMIFHISRGEFQALGINLALGSLAAFVAWGRWKKVPIVAR